MTKDSAYQRVKRRFEQRAQPWFNAIRIPWFFAWSLGGIWFATSYLVAYPWHHAMIMWVFPAGVAGLSLVRLYQSLSAWLTVQTWLNEDAETARARMDDIQRHTHVLPPWTRAAYIERRRALRRNVE